MVTLPENFNELTVEEQEKILVLKLQQLHALEDKLRRLIGQVRSGSRAQLPVKY